MFSPRCYRVALTSLVSAVGLVMGPVMVVATGADEPPAVILDLSQEFPEPFVPPTIRPDEIRTGYTGHFTSKSFDPAARPLASAVSQGDRSAVKRIVAAGAPLNARATEPVMRRMTLLQAAIWSSWHPLAVEILLESGADPELADAAGDTALIYAARSWPLADAASVERLLIAGVKVDAPGNRGRTPLMYAVMHDKRSLPAVRCLLKHNASVSIRDSGGWSPLMHATRGRRASIEIVRLLLDEGAEVDSRHRKGGTALISAAYARHEGIVRLLLKAGADPNLSDQAGWTPLLAATMAGEASIVTVLLDAGADATAQDRLGRTPLSVATLNRNAEIESCLRRAAAR